jgi:hypothetical protein
MNIKIAMVVVLTMLTISCFSQTTFGVRAGVNFFNINTKDAGVSGIDGKIKPGFNIGANAEIPVGIDFYVQPGLLFSTKGAKSKSDDGKLNLSYLEIPVNFLYTPELGKGRILLGFGPYAAFAVGGTYKVNGASTDIQFENSIPSTTVSGYYKKGFDAGGNLLFGYRWANRFSVQLDAQLGLVNIHTKREGTPADNASEKNTGFGVSFGYRFGK